MRKIICIFVLLNCLALASAYDFRQVIFGNHYEQLKEIKSESEIEKLRNELEPLIKYYNSENGYYTNHGGMNALELEFYKIYKESYANGTIYRMLRYDDDGLFKSFVEDGEKVEFNWLDGLYQFVFIKTGKASKCLGVYEIHQHNSDGGWNADGDVHIYKNFAAISKDSNITAFLLSKTTNSRTDFFREKRIEVIKKSKGLWLFFDDDFMTRYPKSMDFEKATQTIRIEASFPLIDKDRPFMYTLQNAFDGDEKTAFVENTEDNLLELKITPSQNKEPFKCKALRIINGYASSEKLYKSNNRIHEIKSEKGDSFVCKDDTLSYQEAAWASSQLSVESVYKGEKYSDTCLAEIDFLLDSDSQGVWYNQ